MFLSSMDELGAAEDAVKKQAAAMAAMIQKNVFQPPTDVLKANADIKGGVIDTSPSFIAENKWMILAGLVLAGGAFWLWKRTKK